MNKMMKKVMAFVLMCTMIFALVVTSDAAEQGETVTLDGPTASIFNKQGSDGPVTFTYTVENIGAGFQHAQGGIQGTAVPTGSWPYTSGTLIFSINNVLFIEGCTYTITMTPDSNNKVSFTGSYTTQNSNTPIVIDSSLLPHEAVVSVKDELRYFGLYLSTENISTDVVTLTNVSFVDANGKELGMRTHKDSFEDPWWDTVKWDEVLTPVWEGNTVYNESVMVIENADGSIAPISLAYPIDSIISVRSSSLTTTYEENVDYKIENGKLVILSNGSIPITDYTAYYPTNAIAGQTFNRVGGGYIYFTEGSYFHKRQIVITYQHNSSWDGEVPKAQAQRIPSTIKKLEDKEALNIVYYGDSITVGANSSAFVNAAPYMPKWADIVTAALKMKYGYTDITSVNTAVGGMTSSWGIDNIQANVIDKNPDLVFIGFGMNDRIPLSQYKQNTLDMIAAVRASNPNCEFILVGTMLPNAEAEGFFVEHDKMVGVLEEIAQEGTGIAVADITSVHNHLLSTKKYADMTGNNVNHTNDFLGSIYVQVVMSIFEDEDDNTTQAPGMGDGDESTSQTTPSTGEGDGNPMQTTPSTEGNGNPTQTHQTPSTSDRNKIITVFIMAITSMAMMVYLLYQKKRNRGRAWR